MGCNSCGEQPKHTNKDFTKAVIEINNPETLVLLRKVIIPASMGTEQEVPAAIGKYRNVVLVYEANNHVYLYSSDGIPTLIASDAGDIEGIIERLEDLENQDVILHGEIEDVAGDLASETTAREQADTALNTAIGNETTARQLADTNLQGQIDAITASSDVTDIVGTYAQLQAYDTSTLGENDIIKVLQDESQNDETTYYRWSTTTQSFTLIGEEGPYYTKSQADVLLNAKQNALTAGSNISIVGDTISATDTTYTAGSGLALNGTQFSVDTTAIATQSDLTAGLATKQDTLTAGANVQIANNTISATDTTYSDFTGTDGTTAGAQGLVPAPTPADVGKFLSSDGTWDTAGGGGGDTVYSTKTTSTSATGGAVYIGNLGTDQVPVQDPSPNDNHYKYFWALPSSNNGATYGQPGNGTVNILGSARGAYSVSIGLGAGAASYGAAYAVMVGNNANAGPGGVSIGDGSGTNQDFTGDVCIGRGAAITAFGVKNSISLGYYARATRTGELNIGIVGQSGQGFNSTDYRVIGGVHDGQGAHDAATYGQVISYAAINGAGAPTTATEGKYVGQLYYDTTNEAMYFLKTIDTTTTPTTYTWEALSAGGGSGPTVVQTTGTSTTDVMSQKASTALVYPSYQYHPSRIRIGSIATATSEYAVAIGDDARASALYGIALGSAARANGDGSIAISGGTGGNQFGVARGPQSIAIGYGASAGQGTTGEDVTGAIALGAGALARNRGEMNIGSGSTSYGYNSSNYRLLTGLYDPQSAHDAATKGYCDNAIINGGTTAPTTTTIGAVGTQYTYVDTSGTPTAHLCVCVAVDTSVTPNTYTWQTLI